MGLVEDCQINIAAAEKGSSEMAQGINAYVNVLKNVSDMMSKLQLFDVNKEKNEIQRERTKAETALGAVSIFANLEGTLEEKRQALANALQNKKAVRDLVNQVKFKKGLNDEDNEVDVEEFYGVDVEGNNSGDS